MNSVWNEWIEYVTGKLSPTELLSHLADTMQNIATLQEEIGFVRQSELRAEVQAWEAAATTESTMEGRKRAAKYGCSKFTTELFDLESKLAAAVELKYLLLKILEVGNSGR